MPKIRGTQRCIIGHGKSKYVKIKVCVVELWGKTKQLYYSSHIQSGRVT